MKYPESLAQKTGKTRTGLQQNHRCLIILGSRASHLGLENSLLLYPWSELRLCGVLSLLEAPLISSHFPSPSPSIHSHRISSQRLIVTVLVVVESHET